MKVIIAGCGRVGSGLATRLALDGHDVAVIDKNPTSLAALGDGFTGARVRGLVFDRDSLITAGIEHADAFVAVTSGDNSNVVSSIIAREIFRVPRVIARIYDPRRAEIYRRFGIEAVSSVRWSVNEISTLLGRFGSEEVATFGDGEARLVAVHIEPRLAGRPVSALARPGETVVVAVVRSGAAFVPTGGETLEAADVVYLSVASAALGHLERAIAP